MPSEKTVYSTAPELICIEKSELSLTFSHFGSVSLYNSLNPALSLELLRRLKRPKTLAGLKRELKSLKKINIESELLRLQSAYLVTSWRGGETKGNGPTPQRNLFPYLAKDDLVLTQMRKTITSTRVGIVDLAQVGGALSTHLNAVGFTQVAELSSAALTPKNSRPLADKDLIIVIGGEKDQLEFSKLNQIFHRWKKLWMLVTLDIFGGVLGPTFGAGGGPCYDCVIDHSKRHYTQQFAANDYVDFIAGRPAAQAEFANLPMTLNVLPYVAMEAVKVRSHVARPMTCDGFFRFDMFNFRMDYNVIHPSPTCPVCTAGVRGP